MGDEQSPGPNSLEGVAYDYDGTAHVVPRHGTVWTDEQFNERKSALCGAGFRHATGFLPVNGMRLSDEFIKRRVCTSCVSELQDRGASIPGFMDQGEIVGEAAAVEYEGVNQ